MKLKKVEGKYVLTEGFSGKEIIAIKKVVQKCFKEKGLPGINSYDVLNSYLGKLNFEVDASDIKIEFKGTSRVYMYLNNKFVAEFSLK